MLLPGKYSQLTEVDKEDTYDVRQNLKTFKQEENDDKYCVVFKVEKAMKACRHNEDTEHLVRGKVDNIEGKFNWILQEPKFVSLVRVKPLQF